VGFCEGICVLVSVVNYIAGTEAVDRKCCDTLTEVWEKLEYWIIVF